MSLDQSMVYNKSGVQGNFSFNGEQSVFSIALRLGQRGSEFGSKPNPAIVAREVNRLWDEVKKGEAVKNPNIINAHLSVAFKKGNFNECKKIVEILSESFKADYSVVREGVASEVSKHLLAITANFKASSSLPAPKDLDLGKYDILFLKEALTEFKQNKESVWLLFQMSRALHEIYGRGGDEISTLSDLSNDMGMGYSLKEVSDFVSQIVSRLRTTDNRDGAAKAELARILEALNQDEKSDLFSKLDHEAVVYLKQYIRNAEKAMKEYEGFLSLSPVLKQLKSFIGSDDSTDESIRSLSSSPVDHGLGLSRKDEKSEKRRSSLDAPFSLEMEEENDAYQISEERLGT